MTEAASNPRGTVRWTACETYTWVAFGEARPLTGNIEFPRAEWSEKWRNWPTDELSRAFVCIAMNKPWGEATWGGRGEDHCMDMAHGLIRESGKSAEVLIDLLAADTKKCERNCDELRRAFTKVMAAVREGKLMVWARPALGPSAPNVSAVHQTLDPLLFEGPRAISVFGCVGYASYGTNEFEPRPENDFGFMDYEGPWFDEVRFNADQVREIWPTSVKVQPEILEWLTNAAEAFVAKGRGKPMRDALVQDCVAALGCPTREAEAAYKLLSDHLRRRRGDRDR